jgi:uncharacterized protein with GYD domain
MPTYVSLLNWTDQGIRNVKETIQRADSAGQLAQKHGGSLQVYWSVGPYDIVSILEAPDDESGYRLPLRDWLVGQRQDDYPSRLRPRRDVEHPWEAWLISLHAV